MRYGDEVVFAPSCGMSALEAARSVVEAFHAAARTLRRLVDHVGIGDIHEPPR